MELAETACSAAAIGASTGSGSSLSGVSNGSKVSPTSAGEDAHPIAGFGGCWTTRLGRVAQRDGKRVERLEQPVEHVRIGARDATEQIVPVPVRERGQMLAEIACLPVRRIGSDCVDRGHDRARFAQQPSRVVGVRVSVQS